MTESFGQILDLLNAQPSAGRRQKWICRCPNKSGHKNGDSTPSACLFISEKTGDLMFNCKGCHAKGIDIAKLIGVPMKEWCAVKKGAPVIVTSTNQEEFVYRNAGGKIVYRVLRGLAHKSFTQQRAIYDRNQVSIIGWANTLSSGMFVRDKIGSRRFRQLADGEQLEDESGAEREVFDLPRVELVPFQLSHWFTRANSEIPLFVVEGERKVMALESLGFYATCNNGGSCNWTNEHGKWCASKRVIIIPDNDEPGFRHAQHVAGNLVDNGVHSVYINKGIYRAFSLHEKVGVDIKDLFDIDGGRRVKEYLTHTLGPMKNAAYTRGAQ